MIIPSIDLMGGKAVQLRKGKKLALTSDRDPLDLAREFNRYGPVAVVDLDAALGQGNNRVLIESMCRVAEVRVGGGIRDEQTARNYLRAGASKLVIGTAATPEFLLKFPKDRLVVALDHKKGKVVDHGWQTKTGETVIERGKRLADYASEFLITFVGNEGSCQGLPSNEAIEIVKAFPTSQRLTLAGGIKDTYEAVSWAQMSELVNVQVGMALYTGALDLAQAVASLLKEYLTPTIVQDESGQILMLAYSDYETLQEALRTGRGIYYSRSRKERWKKGATSGNTQELISCRFDCDRDALIFTVRQTGVACHNQTYSCFGDGQRKFSLHELFDVILQRLRNNRDWASYTARLAGDEEFLYKKIIEEAKEVISADTMENLRWEIADLLYHLMVLAAKHDLTMEDIISELSARAGQERKQSQ